MSSAATKKVQGPVETTGDPGSTYPDHEVRPWEYPVTYPPPPPQEAGDRVLGATSPLHPFPPPLRAA